MFSRRVALGSEASYGESIEVISGYSVIQEEQEMLRCERCESSYSPLRSIGIENCPRCQAKDNKAVPLTFKAFELPKSAKEPADERSVA